MLFIDSDADKELVDSKEVTTEIKCINPTAPERDMYQSRSFLAKVSKYSDDDMEYGSDSRPDRYQGLHFHGDPSAKLLATDD